MSFKRYTLSHRPDLRAQVRRLGHDGWPEFLLHGDTDHWGHLFTTFAEYQLLLCDGEERLVAMGHTVPLLWDGTPEDLPATIDEIIVRALKVRESGTTPNTFSALAAIVDKEYQGEGLSPRLLREMRALARQSGCQALIVPVRPTWKSRYPLISMERYCTWTRADGAPFDPWIRVHWRLGAEQLRSAPKTLTVTGSVAEWEEWTGIPMPDSGEYVVPGALQPVMIDRERDLGIYEDPNVWMKHGVQPGA